MSRPVLVLNKACAGLLASVDPSPKAKVLAPQRNTAWYPEGMNTLKVVVEVKEDAATGGAIHVV
ncbi:MAG: hypothetical protein P4L90_13635 [Rhodopila sp.]|nr:hypothetical protein [Rhodopila sp.]